MRDATRSRVYAAELQVREALERGSSTWDFFGSNVVLPPEQLFGDLSQAAEYAADVLADPQVVARFGTLPPVAMVRRAGNAMAHYQAGVIHLPVDSDWALREMVVLHELAHHIVSIAHPSAAAHGEQFVKVYLFLVRSRMCVESELILRAAFESQGLTTA